MLDLGDGFETSSAAKLRRTNERARLHALTLREPPPTSVAGFRNHPVYTLKRFIRKNEIVRPRRQVGCHRGDPVYLRAHVHKLHTKRTWFRTFARVVRDSELQNPAKLLPATGKILTTPGGPVAPAEETTPGVSDEGSSAPIGRLMYGRWQTEPYKPPAVVDGKVPKNGFGNVELWSHEHLPLGCVHLQLPGVASLAQILSIDHAQALVGFDRRGKGMAGVTPRFNGIVVAQTHADTLRDAWQHRQMQREREAERKRRVRVWSRWEVLVRGVLVTESVRKTMERYA